MTVDSAIIIAVVSLVTTIVTAVAGWAARRQQTQVQRAQQALAHIETDASTTAAITETAMALAATLRMEMEAMRDRHERDLAALRQRVAVVEGAYQQAQTDLADCREIIRAYREGTGGQ